ncbi:MAG: YggS family pyridoxal phosphate-dependent enzyme [Lentisphaeria bacterium]|nr:YggS family pyridoxal phosphate-dependent enzyme [Lentisphaeria bacterium]
MSDLKERYFKVRDVFKSYTEHVGNPEAELIAISKTRTVEEIQALYDLGHRHFGENKVQELDQKVPALPNDIVWHFIGHIQSNKAKPVLQHVNYIHAVDSIKLLDRLQRIQQELATQVQFLLQFNVTNEDQKYGFRLSELEDLESKLSERPLDALRGCMCMTAVGMDAAEQQSTFQKLVEAQHRLQLLSPQINELSMGMSGDWQQAVGAGARWIRIGTAIFGPRNYGGATT